MAFNLEEKQKNNSKKGKFEGLFVSEGFIWEIGGREANSDPPMLSKKNILLGAEGQKRAIRTNLIFKCLRLRLTSCLVTGCPRPRRDVRGVIVDMCPFSSLKRRWTTKHFGEFSQIFPEGLLKKGF